MARPVVITGMGCVTPLGTGVDAFWQKLVSGTSGIRRLSAFDPEPYGCQVAGEVVDFDPAAYMSQRELSGSSRCVQFSLASARMALDDARLDVGEIEATRVGVFMGTSVGTFEHSASNYATFLEKGIRRVHPLFPAQSYPGVIATQLAISLGVRGPAFCISSACTSATDSLGLAMQQIQGGLIDYAVAGGTETPITPLLFASFDRLGAMSRRNDSPETASRPFAASRDGFVLAEGSGVCILEAEDRARERGAPVLARLRGYAASSDAYHPFSPDPEGREGARAVVQAMEVAELEPRDIDYVNAHAIGSVPNDPVELEILRRVFGEQAPLIPMSSIKSMTGHTMGAAGALELISSVQSIRHSMIPPTLNLADEDLEAGFDHVRDQARPRNVKNVLSTTFGFGSRNAVLIVGGGAG